jgi:hypothetical protein
MRAFELNASAAGKTPASFNVKSRQLRGYLAFFSDRGNLQLYAAAVRFAKTAFEEALQRYQRYPRQAVVRFQCLRALYRIRRRGEAMHASLPVGMIHFDRPAFGALTDMAFGGTGRSKMVDEAIVSDTCRAVQSAIDLLGGLTARTKGLHHDLAESFSRVNVRYFRAGLSRPRLVWSGSFSCRKMGHYDRAHDTVMISNALDRSDVPQSAIDLVIYHELLHKHLGCSGGNGPGAGHFRRFRNKERLFEHYDQAKQALDRLVLSQG